MNEAIGQLMSQNSMAPSTTASLRLSVVMPVYNESRTIARITQMVLARPEVWELVIIDDGSRDGTRDLLREIQATDPRIRLIFHEQNRGKGAAIRTGYAAVQGDVVLVQDADLEYSPDDYPRMLGPLTKGVADVVYGSRFRGEEQRVLFFWHMVGNRLLTLASNMITNLNLTDMETCFKAFRVDVIRRIALEEERFGVEPEITIKVSRLGLRIYEVPISYYGRTYQEGKKIGMRDAFRALWVLFKYGILRR